MFLRTAAFLDSVVCAWRYVTKPRKCASHANCSHMIPWENKKNARYKGKTWVRFSRSWRQVTNKGYDGGRVQWLVISCGALQLVHLCASRSAETIEPVSGDSAARCARDSEQTAAAFYNCHSAATVTG
jgi:hypothetical protein